MAPRGDGRFSEGFFKIRTTFVIIGMIFSAVSANRRKVTNVLATRTLMRATALHTTWNGVVHAKDIVESLILEALRVFLPFNIGLNFYFYISNGLQMKKLFRLKFIWDHYQKHRYGFLSLYEMGMIRMTSLIGSVSMLLRK